VNTYMIHMLERAREVHEENTGMQGRDTPLPNKCPFCIADEDETWFQRTLDAGEKYKKTDPLRPKPLKLNPHCINCPLQSLFKGAEVQQLMDDCVKMGCWWLREIWEGSDE